MSADPADLANLRDLALPPPVAWWPPQAGWWVLAAGMAGLALLGLLALVRRYRANAYRRAALRALPGTPPDRLGALLKRTALAAYPRTEVAGLTGAAWAAFLARTGGFPQATERVLTRAALDPAHPPEAQSIAAARTAARHWISRHRGSP